jgi:hypothetical protein
MQPKTVPKKIKLELLESTTKPGTDGLFYNSSRYLVKDLSVVTPDAIKLLLEVMPLIVAPLQGNKKYQVIFGSRLFNIAAKVLGTKYEILVNLIQVYDQQVVNQLRYLDLAVCPVLESINLSAAESYELINVPKVLREKIWNIPSKSTFAGILGVSRALVSSKPTIKKTITAL